MRLRSFKMQMIGSSHFQNDAQEFIRKSLSSPLYMVGRFFLLFSHRLVNLIRLIIHLLNLLLNAFQTQGKTFWKPLMLLLRLTERKE
ncbi:hypothetical protein Godav_022006 [Gossypium davidsonii]|uniref:Uncharacterized protein n=4 Tax=Gossypium TaxID=3633 RepID=A0A7J8TI67_GOSDV|nr:hypothetical protein [Gossypium davidsonii]MBA0671941.1 hypothetical protein [Gossypium klotzschianum]